MGKKAKELVPLILKASAIDDDDLREGALQVRRSSLLLAGHADLNLALGPRGVGPQVSYAGRSVNHSSRIARNVAAQARSQLRLERRRRRGR